MPAFEAYKDAMVLPDSAKYRTERLQYSVASSTMRPRTLTKSALAFEQAIELEATALHQRCQDAKL